MQGLYPRLKKLQKTGFLIETSEIYVLNVKKNQGGLKLQIIKIYHQLQSVEQIVGILIRNKYICHVKSVYKSFPENNVIDYFEICYEPNSDISKDDISNKE